VTIGAAELDVLSKTTTAVFEILERAWATQDCTLIDMKIEFGVDTLSSLFDFLPVLFLCTKYTLCKEKPLQLAN